MNEIEPSLSPILSCPAGCQVDLVECDARDYSEYGVSKDLFCPACSSHFPVVSGIPLLFPSRSATLIALDKAKRGDLLKEVERIEKTTASVKSYSERDKLVAQSGMEAELATLWEYHLIDKLPTSLEGYNDFLSFVKGYEGSLAGKTVLNVGCGFDPGLELFRAEGAAVVEQDIVIDVLVSLKSRGAMGICCDLRHLPVKAGSFDIVMAHCSLHHILPVEAPVSQMCQALKPGGSFFCDESNRDSLAYRFKRSAPLFLVNALWKASRKGVRGSPFEEPVDVPQLVNLLRNQQGFDGVEIQFSKTLGHYCGFECIVRPLLLLCPSLSTGFRLHARKPKP